MRQYIKILSVIILIATCGTLAAQTRTSKAGTTASQFLKIGVHARQFGMGEAAVAAPNNAGAIHYNPAGIASYGVQEVVFSQSDWLVETSFTHFSATMNFGHLGTIGVQATSMDYGEQEVTTIRQPGGTGEQFTAQDLSLGIAYARNLTKDFAMGAQLKYITNRIWNMNAAAVAIDLGALFVTPFDDIRLGMAITNFGSKMMLQGRDTRFYSDADLTMDGNNDQIPANTELAEWAIPLTFRVGLAYDVISTDNLVLTTAVDALHPSDNSEYIDLGTELSIAQRIYLRAGLRGLFMVDQVGGLSLGAGLFLPFSPSNKIKLDYAWVDYADLGSISMLSLAITY